MSSPLTRTLTPSIGTTPTIAYTVPTSYTATLVGLNTCNTTSSLVTVTVQIQNAASTTTCNLIYNLPLPANVSFVSSGQEQKVTLIAGDKVLITASAASSVDAILSIAQLPA